MAQHFDDIAEVNRLSRLTDRHVRWAYLEEKLRLAIAERFKALMGRFGLSQGDVAEKSATTQPMLSRFLGGDDRRSPSLETLVKVADALGADVDVRIVERVADANAPTDWCQQQGEVVTGSLAPAKGRWRENRRFAGPSGVEPLEICATN